MKTASLLTILITFITIFALIGLTIYGLVLAFSASIILGIIVFLVQPAPVVIGIAALCGRADACRLIAQWLGLPI